MLCKQLGLPLDVVGGRGVTDQKAPLTEYEQAIQSLCDGEGIRFLGEIGDEEKIKLMQTCRALIYTIPPTYSEVTSHKVQEAMLCGAPIITSPIGALSETPDWIRLGSAMACILVFFATRKNVGLGVLAGTLMLIALTWQ